MSNAATLDAAEIAKAHEPSAAIQGTDKEIKGSLDITKHNNLPTYYSSDDEYDDKPTEEELHTLKRVAGPIRWGMFTIAFVELCERFSYYGSSVLYTNFVFRPLPEGQPTGANPTAEGVPGALGKGQAAANGIVLFNQFFAYLMPLVGAWIADSRLGRYKTIHVAILISIIAHVILVIASIPSVIKKTDAAFGVFILGLLSLCVGTGFFKANISPLLAEQNQDRIRVVTKKNGERVILDPALTNARLFLYFYFAINIGAVVGQVSMVWTEKYVGFWLAFLLPTALFLLAPLVLWSQKKKYHLTPPTGSVLSKFMHMFFYTLGKSGWFKRPNWDVARPSNVPAEERPVWMTYDDAWVDQVRRGLMACKVFLFLPIFHLAYNQMTGNLTSQASSMELHGVPNDVIQNLNPISIVIMIPIFDYILYPGLEKMGFHFTPIKRMTTGFFFSAASMIAACVMQYYIYKMSPCGDMATECEEGKAPINVWAQSLPYILIGISEIFTNVTSYEYAFSKAPDNMKSLVMSVNLFMSAFASAVGQAFTPLSEDPKLVWNYGVIAVIAFVGGAAFYLCFRHLDHDEDKWNMIKKSKYLGNVHPNASGTNATPYPPQDADIEKA